MRIRGTARYLEAFLAIAIPVAAFGLAACSSDGSQEAAEAFSQPGGTAQLPAGHPDMSGTQAVEGVAPNSVAGLSWTVPEAWQTGAERPMRAATYLIGPESGEADGAECAVFYFGTGQGGDVDANVERWIAQFEQPDGSASEKAAKTSQLEVDGLNVTRVEVTGTYTASMGPMSGAKTNKENYQLLGAIVEGPQGAVFFKLTGPEQEVGGARSSFDAMLKSVHKS
jgi:hypothetical protein